MKVFLYVRVSSEEQVKHGYSLDAQENALISFCKANNHVILGIYRDEGISGRKPYTKRPAMVQLLQDLERIKPDMILFTKLDRWFRNIKEYYKVQDILDKNKVYWKAINEEYDTSTASGRLYVNIKLSIAQDEADRTSERIKDVQHELVAQGRVISGSVPFGYKVENKHVVFADNIHIVKEAVNDYLLHQSMHHTIRLLNGKYGTTFTAQKMKALFQNTLLKGEYRGNVNFCEPLLSPSEWDRLQEVIQKNVKYASRKNIFLFTGLIVCPYCNRKMAGMNDGKYKYYRCPHRYQGQCEMPRTIGEKRIEKWLLENIEEDFKINVEMKPKQKKESPKKYRSQLQRLNDMYLLGNIDKAAYTAKSAELQRIIAELSREPKEVKNTFSANWKEVYQMLDDEHKRSFWRGLIKGVRIDKETQPVEILY